jgi:hypothetical protein
MKGIRLVHPTVANQTNPITEEEEVEEVAVEGEAGVEKVEEVVEVD